MYIREMNKAEKRVLVGMSGGIDSTATCLMLREQGYEIVGLTMWVWATSRRRPVSLPKAWALSIMWQMSARLSGGERQRIGIARILLRNPDICLMDEPSSALDALHEKELLHTLQTAYAGKTLLLISHRGSTLTGCSRILRAEDLK